MEAAVVTASHGAMASLLEKLCDLLTEKYMLLKEAKEQISFLKDELENMYAFLKKMSDIDEPDDQARCWAKEIRELSYDIEDSVNHFLYRVDHEANWQPSGFQSFIKRMMNLLATINTRHQTAKEFQGLKRRVMEVSNRRIRYKIDDILSKQNNTKIDLRLLAMYKEPVGLVGIDGPSSELIQLMDVEGVPTCELMILSILGFGGLGKTTLANQIYSKLEGKFQCKSFVSVSQKPNIRMILSSILYQVGFVAPDDTKMETWEDYELIRALQKFLSDKRYFIVIDDIWEAHAWDIIRCGLPENMNGCRIVTTTRIEAVARACCINHSENVYRMNPLSEQNSRSLFFKRIFGSEDACPHYLKEVSAEILKRCGGLPLAIITISSLLASQPNILRQQWEYVKNSLFSNSEVSTSLDGMRQILNLSYINLPHHLKACMLYLGIYPEDQTIKKNDLARQWVAEGFISKAPGNDMESIAKSYFNELINRSMIQPIETGCNNEVMSCRVHDMMLDLILHKSREENFISVIDDIQDLLRPNSKIRRLLLKLDGAIDGSLAKTALSQTRTLARFGSSSYLPSFFMFKHLRVLTIETSDLFSLFSPEVIDLNAICHLFLLRYIKIKAKHHHVVLPSKIGGLQQLQTLEIKPSKGQSFLELPTDIVQLSQLSHLIVPEYVIFPDGIRNMKSLHTLRCFHCQRNSPENIKGLRELTNLTDLEMYTYYRDGGEEEAARCREVVRTCLEKLCSLKCLVLHGADLDGLSLVPAPFHHLQIFHTYISFPRVPEWIGKLRSLYDLQLYVEEALDENVRILAQLPSLIHLSLHIHGTPEDRIINVHGSGFPVLKHFTVACIRISCLAFEAGAMAKLKKFELRFNAQGWDRYGAAPAGIEHLLGLKEIYISIGADFALESNIRAAELALRNAINIHPGLPAANIVCRGDLRWMFNDNNNEEVCCEFHHEDGDESEEQENNVVSGGSI